MHRALKDFGFEELLLKRFEANTAVYYLLLISLFLMETFKENVARGVVPPEATRGAFAAGLSTWLARSCAAAGKSYFG